MNPRILILRLVAAGLVSAACLTGCRKQDVVTLYTAPKEPVKTVSTDLPADHPPVDGSAGTGPSSVDPPEVRDDQPAWTVPAGWQPAPLQQEMEFAAFNAGPQAAPVKVTVVPLSEHSGDLLANINRWEGQLHLPASTTKEDVAKIARIEDLNGTRALYIDLANPAEGRRMLAVILPHAGANWFYKMVGPLDSVTAEQPKFDAFVHSIHFGASDASPSPTPSASTTAGGIESEEGLIYAPPAGWTKEPPKEMRLLGFAAGSGNDKAEVAITRFPAAAYADVLGNLNRWRGQVGLPPTDEQHPSDIRQTTVAGMPSHLINLVGPEAPGQKGRRLIVVVTPDTVGRVWFFKIMGPADAVTKQEAAFNQFLGSLKFAGQDAGGDTGK